FETSGTEFHRYVLIFDYWNAPSNEWHAYMTTLEMAEPLILGVNADGRIGHDGFGSYRGDRDKLIVRAIERIPDVVQLGLYFFVGDFVIRQSGASGGIPV